MPHEPLDRTAETDALLAMAVDALNRAPIIGSTREDARAFETRQNAWLRDVYNPTLAAIRAERKRAGGVRWPGDLRPLSELAPGEYVLFAFADGSSNDTESPNMAVGKLCRDRRIWLTSQWGGSCAAEDPIGWFSLPRAGGVKATAPLIAAMEAAAGIIRRYRDETPPGHSPHMICHEADEVMEQLTAQIEAARKGE